jgi:small conductance mechanosensitive channel
MQEKLVALWQTHTAMLISLSYKLLLTLVIIVAGIFIARLVKTSIVKNNRLKSLDTTLLLLFSKISAYIIYVISLVIVLDIFGINTNSLIALFGAATLAIGLALKNTLSNIAAGIVLLILRPFKVNDFIECSTISGTVREVGLFTIILETADGLYVSSPNNTLWTSPITNFSRNKKRRMQINISISYTDSIEQGLEVLMSLAANEPRILAEPAPQVVVSAMADSSVDLQLRAWTSTSDYWRVYWLLQRQIKVKIEQAGLTIPFPQRELALTGPVEIKQHIKT